MPIRLWPRDYSKKEHISQGEKVLLRNASRNLKDGHFAVDIDPLKMRSNKVKMGLYISPSEGLITFSTYQGKVDGSMIDTYITSILFFSWKRQPTEEKLQKLRENV